MKPTSASCCRHPPLHTETTNPSGRVENEEMILKTRDSLLREDGNQVRIPEPGLYLMNDILLNRDVSRPPLLCLAIIRMKYTPLFTVRLFASLPSQK